MPATQKKKPLIIVELENLLNTPIIVVLKDGRVIKGTLRAFDPSHLNIVLYGVTEIIGDVEEGEEILVSSLKKIRSSKGNRSDSRKLRRGMRRLGRGLKK